MQQIPLEARGAFSFDVFAADIAAQYLACGGHMGLLGSLSYLAFNFAKSGFLLHAAALLHDTEVHLLQGTGATVAADAAADTQHVLCTANADHTPAEGHSLQWVHRWLPSYSQPQLAIDAAVQPQCDVAYFAFVKATTAHAMWDMEAANTPPPSQGAVPPSALALKTASLTAAAGTQNGLVPPPGTQHTRAAIRAVAAAATYQAGTVGGVGGGITPLSLLLQLAATDFSEQQGIQIGSAAHTLCVPSVEEHVPALPVAQWLAAAQTSLSLPSQSGIKADSPVLSALEEYLNIGVAADLQSCLQDHLGGAPVPARGASLPPKVSLLTDAWSALELSQLGLSLLKEVSALTKTGCVNEIGAVPASRGGQGDRDPPVPNRSFPQGGLRVNVATSWLHPHAAYYGAVHHARLLGRVAPAAGGAGGGQAGSTGGSEGAARALLKEAADVSAAFHFDKPLGRKVSALRQALDR